MCSPRRSVESDMPDVSDAAAAGFAGTWLDDGIGLLLDVTVNADGTLSALYDGGAEVLSVGADGIARGLDMTLQPSSGRLAHCPAGRRHQFAGALGRRGRGRRHRRALPLKGTRSRAGDRQCWRQLVRRFPWLSGCRVPLMPLAPAGGSLAPRIPCSRCPAPGDWTVRVCRSPEGAIAGLSIGCWLARDMVFSR